MGREPLEYIIRGAIVRASDEFVVTVVAKSTGHPAPGPTLTEKVSVTSLEDAMALQRNLVREMSLHLRMQGHRLIDVETDIYSN